LSGSRPARFGRELLEAEQVGVRDIDDRDL
jgi:hypothetical protein